MELSIRLSNGQILRGSINRAGEELKAILILVHGVGEHIKRYKRWIGNFHKEKIGFAAVDLPGHGLSDGKRGHIKSYHLTDEMIEKLIDECRSVFPGVPIFLYGHSLGGGIVLDYLVRNNPDIRGAIVTSPWLKLSFEPDKSKLRLAGMMRNVFPGLVQRSGLIVEHLSHDPEVVKEYKNDPLVHDKISVSLFLSAVEAAENALTNAGNLKVPVLLLHGSDDQICSPAGSSEFASRTKLAEFRLWEGGYHELHNEIFNDKVFEYILTWIGTRLD